MAIQSVNDNLQVITSASENVSDEADEVLNSIQSMRSTMSGFNV